MATVRVLLVDDHPIVLSGIHGLLEKADGIEIVGEAADGEQALQLVETIHPDVILLDMELPDIQGAQLAQQIQARYPQVKILVLSAHDDPVYVQDLLALGAAGYLMKEEAPEVIVEAIHGIAQGKQGWYSRRIGALMASWVQTGGPGEAQLTLREREVLRLVVQGKTNLAIASELEISEKTVEKYMSIIFTKLNVTSRVEAAVQAVQNDLV
jgi:two-component system, NarL family, response regulator DegU